MNRRDFLISSTNSLIMLGLSPLLSSRLAHAEEKSELNFFVQIYMYGGWDVTLGTDPWLGATPSAKDLFLEYDPSNIERSGSLAFGPSFLPMKEFSADLNVINGIFMSPSDNGHDAAARYIKSGSTESQWGSLAVELSETKPSPLLGILTNEGITTGIRNPTITNLSVIQTMVDSGLQLDGFESEENSRNRLSKIQTSLANATEQVEKLRQIMRDFNAAGETIGAAHQIAASFASGVAQIADFGTRYERLDTHDNHAGVHMTNQKTQWTEIAELLRVFKKTQMGNTGVSLFDRTTFMITSEFARTPALNSSQGKDHNPLTNSVVLIGPRFRGNRLIGGSHLITADQSKNGSSYHIASPIDMATGQALNSKENATILRPENVVATIVDSLGISRRRFASVGPKVPGLMALLKK